MRRRPQAWWLLPGLLLLLLAGFGLRLPGLFANTFHPDEALFASWARLIAVWRDPLLQTQAVDKPPLLFYLQALFYPLLATPAGFPARLPNFIASLLLLPLTGRAAWQLYRDPLAAVAAVALVAFSPLAIQFSSSAFTNPLLTTWLLAAVVASSAPGPYRRRAWWSGLFWGLALATKYQALLFLLLLLGLAWLARWPGRAWGWWLAGFAPAGALLLLWDGLRPGGFSLWHNQFSSYGGLRLAWSWELWPRLAAWANLSRYQLAIPWPLLLLLLGLGLLVLRRQPAAGAAYDALLFLSWPVTGCCIGCWPCRCGTVTGCRWCRCWPCWRPDLWRGCWLACGLMPGRGVRRGGAMPCWPGWPCCCWRKSRPPWPPAGERIPWGRGRGRMVARRRWLPTCRLRPMARCCMTIGLAGSGATTFLTAACT